MQSVTTERHGDVLVILVNNPPVNALSWHVRQGLKDGIEEALADDAIKAVVTSTEVGDCVALRDRNHHTRRIWICLVRVQGNTFYIYLRKHILHIHNRTHSMRHEPADWGALRGDGGGGGIRAGGPGVAAFS